MLRMIKPYMTLFVTPTEVRKMHLALDLLKREYFSHFDYIIILCTTLQYNKTYYRPKWFLTNPDIIQILLSDTPGNSLYHWTEQLSAHLVGHKTLFLIDDIISNKMLNKQSQTLLGLAAFGGHKGHL